MATINNLTRKFISMFITSLVLAFAVLPACPSYADAFDLPPSVIDIASTFSDKYCIAISDGVSAEKAGEVAARQMITGLMFSGVIKEVMDAPKEDIASLLAADIYDGCGSDIGISRKELNSYIVDLANNGPSQSQSRSFNPSALVNKRINS